ncbi:DUF1553 domain-containing protein [Planctomycetes bacterium Pan216]
MPRSFDAPPIHAAWGRLFLLLLLVGAWPAPLVADDKPVAYWGFGTEESSPLEPHGSVHRDVPGPRPDLYPDFAPDNTAVRLDGRGARFVFADPGPDSPYDFTNGDEITLEAWVKIDKINEGENVYVVGKGRTGNRRFAADNQNWALRIRRLSGKVCISFLFSSVLKVPAGGPSDANWHRWTSDHGFAPGDEWHHIAIAYRFGDPDSIVGVIDGKAVKGRWDAGGPTRHAPTVDDDEIWIGSSLGGSPSTSLRGDLDELSIYRKALPVATLQSRYRGPNASLASVRIREDMPELGDLDADAVQLTFHEGMPSHSRWLTTDEKTPAESLRWRTESFLLDRLPQQYESWGIRQNWNGPVLVRMAADVSLSPGQHRVLIRVRGLSRLWVDGKLVARSKPTGSSQNGFEKMTPPAAPPKPGLRIAEHRQQEVFGSFYVQGGAKTRVVLETLVGGKKHRTDPGETCVAIETDDGKSFVLLQPGEKRRIHLTDREVRAALARQRTRLQVLDDQRRRAAARSQDSFWTKRHAQADAWAKEHPAPNVPSDEEGLHPIDAFLEDKIRSALAASSRVPLQQSRHFHQKVMPILRDHCFRCHGKTSKGGLLLTSLDAAREGGDTGMPAVEPGDPGNSELMRRIRSHSPDEQMPPGDKPLTADQVAMLEDWIQDGARWPDPPIALEDTEQTPLVSDESFLRRAFLDTVGVIPNENEAKTFLNDPNPDKRDRLVDRLLADDRWADHWTSYWQDVLAENPTLLNASLNTTGPFRWFIYDSFRDNKPIDRFVTELILLRGSPYEGGSAGFGIAANNPAPFAAKGQIVSRAFLGIELQCARCHDSPYHSTTQQDLYSLAAMFRRKPVTVPAGSRVPASFFESQQRTPLIEVTLAPGKPVPPVWPFGAVTGSHDDPSLRTLMRKPDDSREKLAALITDPRNERFAQVVVNRVWRRLIGTGIVESPDDWEGSKPSHPELLEWLAQELVTHQYDLKHVARLILTSDLYQREGVRYSQSVDPEVQFFVAPNRRRMSAEQLIDSLHAAVGKPLDVEELTFAPEAGTKSAYRLNLGVPRRAWQFSSLGNERDRPSLSLPRARAIADLMEAFGWQGARQNPRTDREVDPNVLQPGVVQNSDASVLLTRASEGSGLAEAAVRARTPEELVDTLFLTLLSRFPRADEREMLTPLLASGFEQRLLDEAEQTSVEPLAPLPVVTWSNHVQPEANSIAVEMEQRAKAGPAPDPRLRPEWRQIYEDLVWSILNTSDFVWIP